MKTITLIVALLVIAEAHAATIAIDPNSLTFTPAEKAALCGQTPVCQPDPGTQPGGGGNGSWNGQCPGFANTRVLTMNWANPVRLYTKDAGEFGANDAVVVQFTTGTVSTGFSLVTLSAAEYNSSPSTRIAALSDKPCDFAGLPNSAATTNSITFKFALGTGTGFGYYPVLGLNTTYYLNIKNAPASSCTQNNACGMFVDLLKPGGL